MRKLQEFFEKIRCFFNDLAKDNFFFAFFTILSVYSVCVYKSE